MASSIAVSLGLHALCLGALALVVRGTLPDAAGGSGGGGVLLVDLAALDDPAAGSARVAPAPVSPAAASAPASSSSSPPPSPPQVPSHTRRSPHPASLPPPTATVPASLASIPEPASPPAGPPPARDAAAPPAGLRASAGAAAGPSTRGGAGDTRSWGALGGAGPLERVARPASRIRPHYPEAARQRGDEAEVIVEAWVAASGRVERARVRDSAGRDFDAAALQAVHDARFFPAWRDGQPVDSLVAMRLHFELEH